MKIKLATLPAVAALMLTSGAALADGPNKNKHGDAEYAQKQDDRDDRRNQRRTRGNGSVAAGAATAGPDGAAAVGGAGSGSFQQGDTRRARMRDGQRCVPSTTATNTNGAASTTRRSGSAAISTSGTARGSTAASSSSQGNVYANTDPDFGSTAEADGSSDAMAESRRPC